MSNVSVSAMGIIKLPKTTKTQVEIPSNAMKTPGDLMQQVPTGQFNIPVQGPTQVKGSRIPVIPQVPSMPVIPTSQNAFVSSSEAIKQVASANMIVLKGFSFNSAPL